MNKNEWNKEFLVSKELDEDSIIPILSFIKSSFLTSDVDSALIKQIIQEIKRK